MSPSRLRECLGALGWSQRALAEKLSLHESRVRRMARGLVPVPDEVAAWLETLAAVHVSHPTPQGWRGLDVGVQA